MARGTLYLITANIIFSLSGYAIHFWLGRYLGPAEYGTFGVVLSLMTTVNLFIIFGIPLGASKYIAEDDSKAWGIIRDTNRTQMVFCALIFGLYFSLAGVIANLLDDPSLTPYIRISALAIPTYAFYSNYNVGYLNGLRKFGQQAISITGVSLSKIAFTFLLVLVGFGINGAIIGYIVSALIGFLLAWRFLRPIKKTKANFGWKKLVMFGIQATAFAVAFYLLMSIDLFAVKAIASSEAEVGYYTAATTISKAPYFLFTGLALTIMPSISKSTASNNIDLTRNYIRQSMRYMLMMLIPIVVLISATSSSLITLLYSSQYIDAAAPLSILVFGLAYLSIFLVLANIIMGSGKPMIVMGISLLLVVIDTGLNILLIPKYELIGAAYATTISGFLGMCIAAFYVILRYKTLVNIKSLCRIFLASVIIYIIALYASVSPQWLPLIYIGLFTLFTGILLLTKELNKEDLAMIKKILPLKKVDGGDDDIPPQIL